MENRECGAAAVGLKDFGGEFCRGGGSFPVNNEFRKFDSLGAICVLIFPIWVLNKLSVLGRGSQKVFQAERSK